ncbi:uncharacterized protein isoform X2 [Musca autumnalis]|uniref:uncharacterized protein isoform X2 n=1 Tax=Musca autumnalis TaxID=221902 RepID=UPI003CE6A1D9
MAEECEVMDVSASVPQNMGGKKSSAGAKPSELDNIDNDVNKILTPFTYSSVAKKPKKPYVHRPGAPMGKRLFDEPSPSRPVFMQDNHKVTELEKITVELLNFMKDFFKATNNGVATEAMGHFQARIQKCGVAVDRFDNNGIPNHQNGQS